jgi:hypothetical protein
MAACRPVGCTRRRVGAAATAGPGVGPFAQGAQRACRMQPGQCIADRIETDRRTRFLDVLKYEPPDQPVRPPDRHLADDELHRPVPDGSDHGLGLGAGWTNAGLGLQASTSCCPSAR